MKPLDPTKAGNNLLDPYLSAHREHQNIKRSLLKSIKYIVAAAGEGKVDFLAFFDLDAEELIAVCMFGFLTSSSTTRL